MNISWKNIKISIAGARLSHLVQKDKIWDHGSMVEYVRTVFMQLQKAANNGNCETVRKYLTMMRYQQLKNELINVPDNDSHQRNPDLVEVDIISVHPAKGRKPDQFKVVLKERVIHFPVNELMTSRKKNRHDFEEQWLFRRQGDWWLLNEIKKPG